MDEAREYSVRDIDAAVAHLEKAASGAGCEQEAGGIFEKLLLLLDANASSRAGCAGIARDLALLQRTGRLLGFEGRSGATGEVGGLPPELSLILEFYLKDRADGLPLGFRAKREELLLKSRLVRRRTISNEDCYVRFLKDYSSFTPLLPSATNQRLGGGYFAALLGFGCVIDPGHHFLDNYYAAGYSIADIDGVIVTHFHDDHYADLPALLSLLRARSWSAEHRVLVLVDQRTLDRFGPLLKGANHLEVKHVHCKASPVALPGGTELCFLPTFHSDGGGAVPGFGLAFNIYKRNASVVISSDTAWTDEVKEAYAALNPNLQRLFVAHVSTAHPRELGVLTGMSESLHRKHLSILGTCLAVKTLSPRRVVLSEVGEELAAVVDELARLIEGTFHVACTVCRNGSTLFILADGDSFWADAIAAGTPRA